MSVKQTNYLLHAKMHKSATIHSCSKHGSQPQNQFIQAAEINPLQTTSTKICHKNKVVKKSAKLAIAVSPKHIRHASTSRQAKASNIKILLKTKTRTQNTILTNFHKIKRQTLHVTLIGINTNISCCTALSATVYFWLQVC